LYAASKGRHVSQLLFDSKHGLVREPEIDSALSEKSSLYFHELILESLSDVSVLGLVVGLLQESYYDPSGQSLMRDIQEILVESSVAITIKDIAKFDSLIRELTYEERYQAFLAEHPSFLDPLARRVIPKQKLGDEFITDFVIETLDGHYIAVEIERPDTPMFTQRNDFTADFTHAYGQVLDFQEWIESNIAYAQTRMPGISSPRGMLIVGMRQGLSDWQIRKLARLNVNGHGSIRVLCFDDVLESARRLHRNMRRDSE